MKQLITIVLAIVPMLSLAFESNEQLKLNLHSSSENIEDHVNWKEINYSLYKQIRPRANITNDSLTEEQVNEKVREYVKEKYAPVLVKNYSQIYSELKSANGDFSDCNEIVPIRQGDDVLKSLCVMNEGSSVIVQYMTNGYSRGWSKSLVFVFELEDESLQLRSIDLQMDDASKAYVKGI